MVTHGTPPVVEGGWSEFIKDFGIELFATAIATGLLSMVRDYEGRGAGAAAKKPTKSYDRVWAGIW